MHNGKKPEKGIWVLKLACSKICLLSMSDFFDELRDKMLLSPEA